MLTGNMYTDPINLPPLPPGRSAIDVSADYLFKVRQAVRAVLWKTLGEVFSREERNILWCFTVPSIWTDAGRTALRASIVQAGFIRNDNDDRLHLVTESEASLLLCSKVGLLNLKAHDAVLIVDARKGTVDLIAYEVIGENPLVVKELTAGSGDSCG
jgi:hypothetical protein